ncbi:MAG: exodeoxyribonuclease VII large subunit [Nocardioides sp.]
MSLRSGRGCSRPRAGSAPAPGSSWIATRAAPHAAHAAGAGHPRSLVDARREETAQLRDQARTSLRHRLDRAEDDLGHRVARVRSLSPLATLERGYAVVVAADGSVVTGVADLQPPQQVSIRLVDGRLRGTVTDVEPLAGARPDDPAPQEAI